MPDSLARLIPVPIVIVPPPERPAAERPTLPVGEGVLQVGHRFATVALVALLAAIGSAAASRDFYLPLAVAFGCADVGLCAALLSMSLTRRSLPGREAAGVLAFNIVLAGLSLLMMVVARADVIRDAVRDQGDAARAAITSFFTPPPVLPPR